MDCKGYHCIIAFPQGGASIYCYEYCFDLICFKTCLHFDFTCSIDLQNKRQILADFLPFIPIPCTCVVFLIRIITSSGTRILIPKKAAMDFFTSRKSFLTRLAITVVTSNVCKHNIFDSGLFEQHIRHFLFYFWNLIRNSSKAKSRNPQTSYEFLVLVI